jgi:hypothetical protein
MNAALMNLSSFVKQKTEGSAAYLATPRWRVPKPPLFGTVCLKGGKVFSAIKSIFGIRLATCCRGGQECFKAQ